MKKYSLILAAALLLPLTTALADPVDEGFKGRHGHNLERLAKELSLTPEQKASLETIFKEEHEKFRAIHEEIHSRVKAVLNGEQIAKWEQLISQHKGHRGKQPAAE
ncbi:MAG: hypothetical protein PHW13_00735 [Methylococcales bacterium]|nr:hypothetical protein [Methylococcales bacterium]